MPRRSRGHTYRKRTPGAPTLPGESTTLAADDAADVEPADDASGALSAADGVAVVAAPATYRQRIGRVPVPARVGPQRTARAFVTDYGYVVDELKRIGFTFGGLIVLLVIISRILH